MCKELNEFKNVVTVLGGNAKSSTALEDEEIRNRIAKRVHNKIVKLILGGDKLINLVKAGLFRTPIEYDKYKFDDLVWIVVSAVFKHLFKEFGLNKKDEMKLRDLVSKNL